MAVKVDDTVIVHAGLLAAITTKGKHRRTVLNITSWADVERLNKVNLVGELGRESSFSVAATSAPLGRLFLYPVPSLRFTLKFHPHAVPTS